MGLVERDGALRLLAGLLDDAAGGSGRLVLVSGEAGVGKTALVTGFLSRCDDGVRLLAGACDPMVTPRPLGPLVDMARVAGGGLADVLERGSGTGPVLDALLRTAAGGRGPAVVVLEDLHWADEATLDVLCVLGRRAAGVFSSPAVANGVVYAGSDDGNLYAFDLAGGLAAPARPSRSSLHPDHSLPEQRAGVR